MKLHQATAAIFIPDDTAPEEALRRITHLGIGAHQDDLEFMAFHGILNCFDRADRWFGGVTCTNGAGSSRIGPYAAFSDEKMMEVRRREQEAAAVIGRYAAMIQLDHPSSLVKEANDPRLSEDLRLILATTCPEVVYTHNLADKHDTHIAVAAATIRAIRNMPREKQPRQVIGCEVWRNLDWLPDDAKILMDVSGRDNLAAALNGVFDSQISGGKRYDLAIRGRRAANATFLDSHSTDSATQLIFGMDLTPLVQDETRDIAEYVCDLIHRFQCGVRTKLQQATGLSR